MNPLYMVGMLADKQRKRTRDKDNRFRLLNRNGEPNDTGMLKAFIELEIMKRVGISSKHTRLKLEDQNTSQKETV